MGLGRSLAEIVGSNPAGGMTVCVEGCVLSGRGLCDGMITRPDKSYRLWCVVECDIETSRMRRPWPTLGRSATGKKIIYIRYFSPAYLSLHWRIWLGKMQYTSTSPDVFVIDRAVSEKPVQIRLSDSLKRENSTRDLIFPRLCWLLLMLRDVALWRLVNTGCSWKNNKMSNINNIRFTRIKPWRWQHWFPLLK